MVRRHKQLNSLLVASSLWRMQSEGAGKCLKGNFYAKNDKRRQTMNFIAQSLQARKSTARGMKQEEQLENITKCDKVRGEVI